MRSGFKDYDRWKLQSPDDAADDQDRKRLKDERDNDRADEMRDRDKDNERWAEIENAMMHGGG